MLCTAQYKPATSLSGNNNALAHYEQATIKYHMHCPIFMACTGGAVISLHDVIFVYSLNPG